MSPPIGPYTPIVRAGDWLVASGQIGLREGALVEGGLSSELPQAMTNLAGLLESEGSSLGEVVKTTVYLTDMTQYWRMNELYVAAFGDHRPARAAIGVAALPAGACIEIEAWAFVG